MSDDVLSIIPSDPQWQPHHDAVDRVVTLVEDLAPGVADGVDVEIDVTWHDVVTAVDCGGNLERIGCPLCQAAIDTEWWGDLLEAHCDDGFTTLAVEVRAVEDQPLWMCWITTGPAVSPVLRLPSGTPNASGSARTS